MCPVSLSDENYSGPSSETPYSEQSQGYSPDELGDAYRARHVCSQGSVLFQRERQVSSGGGKGCPALLKLKDFCFSASRRGDIQELL
jgi:hypothetical protein